MTDHSRLLALVVGVLLASGCADKAKPDFDRCVNLQDAQKFEEAREACQLAVSKDPDSKDGRLAAARIPVIVTAGVKAESEREARRIADEARMREASDRLSAAQAKAEAAAARQKSLKAQVDAATNPEAKARLQAELAKADAEVAAAQKELRGGSNGKKCNCPPGDPLCSCW